MNLSRPLAAHLRLIDFINVKARNFLPRQRSHSIGRTNAKQRQLIECIYAINLDRQPERWIRTRREFSRVLNASGEELTEMIVRYPAVDARSFAQPLQECSEVTPSYSLRDQLFVEPQPRAMPDRVELDRPIQMSRQEIAVARSHIGVWRQIAAGKHAYSLVVEDDVWIHQGFARLLDRAWGEMEAENGSPQLFDVLYLSYNEVQHGAHKTFLSSSVFRPIRGLWWLSGYVLSRRGAEKLLTLLPCRGPVDLWINHHFHSLDVRATKQPVISQRCDGSSTNCYSVLPALTSIGVLDCEGESLFQTRPPEQPVFAFGVEESGLSSLAMALSMLGYRCCSDLKKLPLEECRKLSEGRNDRVFDAYVNVGAMELDALELHKRYPRAKFIVTTHDGRAPSGNVAQLLSHVASSDVAILHSSPCDKWKVVCEHLRCAPPACSFPELEDLGQRRQLDSGTEASWELPGKPEKWDRSPWVVEARRKWAGISCAPEISKRSNTGSQVCFDDRLETIDTERWILREDTFAGNLALFRPSNVAFRIGVGAVLTVKSESLDVRDYSAASISSRDCFLFGRFETVLQATRVPGLITGFFLHRDSPRQEIDAEIVGNRSDQLLVNVFYNPGSEGARFDYGYRGTPSYIKLGFDAAADPHRYAVEWDPWEIKWLVDGQLVHKRVNWGPTPIPQLPMALHVNTWPSRSKKLAGRLASRRLPATTVVRSIAVEASRIDSENGGRLKGYSYRQSEKGLAPRR